MKRLILVLCIMVGYVIESSAADDREEFMRRRGALLALLDSNSAAVFRSAEPRVRSNDVTYRYRQESNLLYLTGISRPNVFFLAVPGGVRVGDSAYTFLLFLPPDAGEGDSDSPPGPDIKVVEVKKFGEIFGSLVPQLRTLYASAADPGFVNDWLNNKPMFLERDRWKQLEQKHSGLKVKSVGPLIGSLRRIKTPWEVERIRQAIAITGDGLTKAASVCAPGHREYELQGALEGEMIRRGSRYPAFPSIVGSGKNSLILHYDQNRRTMEAGEVVVMDVGAEVEGYAADITRTFPVSGKFTPEQRRVYEAVLEAQQAAFQTMKPGVLFSDVESSIQKVYERHGYARFRKHGASHHLGLDAHDAGAMDTLKTGMVVTVEPGLYFSAEDTTVAKGYRGWGIRVEDDVLITEGGNVVLSDRIPRSVKDVEALVKNGGAARR